MGKFYSTTGKFSYILHNKLQHDADFLSTRACIRSRLWLPASERRNHKNVCITKSLIMALINTEYKFSLVSACTFFCLIKANKSVKYFNPLKHPNFI